MKILVTGGAGFIGSNFLRRTIRRHPDHTAVNVDALTYAGNPGNVASIAGEPNYHFLKADICDGEAMDRLFKEFRFDAVVNFAAESHVDRSILDGGNFIRTNVEGVRVLLEAAQRYSVQRFVQISTDEVYGSIDRPGRFTERAEFHPNSPYAASKAAADELALSFNGRSGLQVVITRSSNNYGPFQFPEKLIPLTILNALHESPVPVYGDGTQVRDWIHVDDHCDAVEAVLARGTAGEAYNVGGGNEWSNIDLVTKLLHLLGKEERLIAFVKDRPAHDRRYALDCSKIFQNLGWKPTVNFESGLSEAVAWYRSHESWWRPILDGAFKEYYERQYGARLVSSEGVRH